MLPLHRILRLAAAAATATLMAANAAAQAFPAQPVTLVVAFAPCGPTDQIARMVAQKMQASLGQPVLVDNRPGGGGQVAANVVKQARPDGHTLFVGATEMFAINPTLFRSFSYSPLKDFRPVAALAGTPMLLVVPRESPANTVQELIQLGKSKPAGLSFASQGPGSIGHMLGQVMTSKAGVQPVHVPYKGSAPALQDVMANRVDMMFDVALSSGPLIAGGKLKALAVAAPQRMPGMDKVPTLTEAGVSGADAGVWFGVMAPAGTPDTAVTALNDAVVKALAQPDVMQRLSDQGMRTLPMTVPQFTSFVRAEIDRWTPLVRESGAVVD
jgi:tripartite-type tricarboxylate transporter receptor subunit TctC